MAFSETHHLPRPHVTKALTEAVANYPLVVLSAPMGYGKTTAARDLLDCAPHSSYYLPLSSGVYSTQYLWDKICSQLKAQGASIVSPLLHMGFPHDPAQIQRALEHGKNHLAGRLTLLVFDDYQYAESPEFNALIEALARENIPGFGIVIITRTRPNLPLEDLRIKGRAIQFGQELLTFSEEDAIAYFQLHGVTDPAAAQTAWRYSEGWPAALWLSVQSYLTTGTLTPVHDMENLLSSTVYSRYSLENKQLLLQLSILPSFTPLQAALVTNDQHTPSRLRMLHEHNALLEYHPATTSYRLHSIFRTFLAERLQDGMDEAARSIDMCSLYRRAGEAFALEDDSLQAAQFFFRAGRDEDLLRILELFASFNVDLLDMFDTKNIIFIIKGIPWSVRKQCPIGYLAFVYYYMSRVNLTEALALLKKAEQHFIGAESISPDQQQRLKGEIELIYAFSEFSDFFSMSAKHQAAHKQLQGPSKISHRQLVWTFGCPHMGLLYLQKAGDYKAIVEHINDNLVYYQEVTDGCSAGGQDLFRAEYLLETGALKKVEPYIMKSAYRANNKEQISTLIGVYFTHARLHLALGQPEKAQTLLHDISTQTPTPENPMLATSLAMCTGYIAALLGKVEKIAPWLREGELTQPKIYHQGKNFARLVYGKALLAQNEWLRLDTVAQDMAAPRKKNPQLFTLIHSFTLQAIAAQHLHGTSQGLPLLQKALEYARPDNIIVSIAEYGPHVTSLLRLLREQYPQDAFISAIHKLAQNYTRVASHSGALLAPREQEVLELAIQGISNAAIAKRLGIQTITVARALSRAYSKLGVKNRTEAAGTWAPK